MKSVILITHRLAGAPGSEEGAGQVRESNAEGASFPRDGAPESFDQDRERRVQGEAREGSGTRRGGRGCDYIGDRARTAPRAS